MRRRLILIAILAMTVTACGGDGGEPSSQAGASDNGDDATTEESLSGDGDAAGVIDAPPPGQATASVDGESYTFDVQGPVGCSITDSEFNFGFIIGDNDVSVGGGGTASESEWRGRIDLAVQEAEGITNYFADFASGDGGTVAVEGNSMSYSGPWQALRPGSSEAESVGDGTISVTCG